MHSKHWSLIAYDIRCPRRLQKLHRFLRTEAYAIQESVFAWYGTEQAKLQLQARMLNFINAEQDDLRGYRMQAGSSIQLWGKSPFVEDIFDSGCPPHQCHLMTQDEQEEDDKELNIDSEERAA